MSASKLGGNDDLEGGNDIDVDWEDDVVSMDESRDNDEDLEIDLADLVGAGDEGDEKEDGPARKKAKKEGGKLVVGFTMDEAIKVGRRHVGFLSNQMIKLNTGSLTCNNGELQAIALSVLPPALVNKASSYSTASEDSQIEIVKDNLTWLLKAFVPVPDPDDSKVIDRTDAEYLTTLLASSCSNEGVKTKVTREQFCLLGVLTFRAMGLLARLVGIFNPPTWKPAYHADMYEMAWRRAQAQSLGVDPNSLNAEEQMVKWRKSHPESKLDDVTFLMEVYRGQSLGVQPPAATSATSSAGGAIEGSVSAPICLDDSDSDESGVNSDSPPPSLSTGKWMHVDVVFKNSSSSSGAPAKVSVDEPNRVEKDYRGGRAVVYALAIENVGYCADVAARYAMQAHKSREGTKPKLQLWWQREIVKRSQLNLAAGGLAMPGTRGGSMGTAGSLSFDSIVGPHDPTSFLLRTKEERSQLHQKYLDEPVPKTMAGFKTHPKYILEAHFKADMGVKPGSKAQGLFKGSRYWLRADVALLQNVRKWGSVMRKVKVEEKDKPAKTVTKSVGKRVEKGEKRPTVESSLYGEWQTEPIVIDPIIDDVIPTNEYGKIEIWDCNTQLVPKGAKFLDGVFYSLPDVRAACKTLGLPYADALVGFEHKAGGLTVPKVGGVVVLEKHVPVVVSATEDLGHRKVQKNEAKKTKRVFGHWHRLVSLVLLRKKVSSKFATPGK